MQIHKINFNFNPAQRNNDRSTVQDAARFGEFTTDAKGGDFFFDDFVITRARSTDGPIEIVTTFSYPDPSLARAEVRAIAGQENVFGNVPRIWVDFDNFGNSAETTFRLLDSTLQTGVQCNTVIWEWQYRTTENGDWVPFTTTRHRVYCAFAPPTDPWNGPLWPEVLEYACKWAQGAQDEPTAATRIAAAVFDLGQQRKISYDQGPVYAQATFDCAAFLTLLKNGVGISQHMNCDDCATVVSTFGNILGCDLNQSEMGSVFETNYVRLIGKERFGLTGFDRHAVAWKNRCESSDPLYDACIQVDADGTPEAPEHKELLPCNVIFGTGDAQANDYKFCLVSKYSPRPCEPQPQFKIRRKLGKSYLTERRFRDQQYLSLFRARYEFDTWPDDKKKIELNPNRPSFQDFILSHRSFAGFKLHETNRFDAADLESVDQIILLFPNEDPKRMVEVYLYVCAVDADPNEFLLQVLVQFNSPLNHREPDLDGAMVFVDQDKTMHIIKRHQLVGLVRSLGREPVSTTAMAKAIREYFDILESDNDQVE